MPQHEYVLINKYGYSNYFLIHQDKKYQSKSNTKTMLQDLCDEDEIS